MKTYLPKLFLVFLPLLICSYCISQPGTLDSSFGVNGKVTTGFGYPQNIYPVSISTQKDGKIIVLSGINPYYNGMNLILVRYRSNGTIDSSFGVNGKVSTRFGDSALYVWTSPNTMIIQDDDKILVGGTGYIVNDAHFRLMRFLPNGAIDSTFGIHGQAKTNIVSWRETYLSSLAIQPNGKILAGGEVDGFCLVRYNQNGSIDSSFGTNGLVYNEADFRTIFGLAVTTNQKIICGVNGPNNDTVIKIQLEAVLPNGKVDSSFGTNGIVITNLIQSNFLNAVGLLPDNSIVVSGQQSVVPNEWQLSLGEFKESGASNRRFGNNGYIIQSFGSPNGYAQKIFFQNDGKLLAAGSVLARFHSNGSLDSSFGINGTAANFTGTGITALQNDGKVIALNRIDDYSWSISRYKGDEPIAIRIQKNISAIEGNSGNTPVSFKIVLNRPSEYAVEVNYKTIDGTAKAGSDYVATSGTLRIKAGKVTGNIIVPVIGDNTREPNERFAVVLSNPVNAVIGTLDSATCTIKNDDPSFAKSIADAQEIKTASSIKLYPNPVKDILRNDGLNADTKTTISIKNAEGKIISSTSITSEAFTKDVKQLSAGTYFVKIESDNKTQTIKFIKQ